jgi:transposase
MEGIFYVLRTGCPWKAVPREFASGSVVHARYQEWRALGVFEKLWEQGLEEYDALKGIRWPFQSMDGAMTKAPLGGKKNRSKPHGSGKIRDEAVAASG